MICFLKNLDRDHFLKIISWRLYCTGLLSCPWHQFTNPWFFSSNYLFTYCKVASSRRSWLVAHFHYVNEGELYFDLWTKWCKIEYCSLLYACFTVLFFLDWNHPTFSKSWGGHQICFRKLFMNWWKWIGELMSRTRYLTPVKNLFFVPKNVNCIFACFPIYSSIQSNK